jgi:hypothetical protein
MATTKLIPVKKLKLDLTNPRTVPQQNEAAAIHSLIAMDPDWFWALTRSLLDGGYHPTENIVVMKSGKHLKELSVREGNRRVAAMKLIFGIVTMPNTFPDDIEKRVKAIPTEWKRENAKIPCAIYGPSQAHVVDKIVRLTHAKSEQAGRAKWNAVARARYERKIGGSEPGLDLLEKYLTQGKNLNQLEAERWGAVYQLTILDEAIGKIAPRLGFANARQLADNYPIAGKNRQALEAVLHDVGADTLGFSDVRADCFESRYGIPPLQIQPPTGTNPPSPAAAGLPASTNAPTSPPAKKVKAVSLNDPRAVKRALRRFHPVGRNREKVVTLLKEARILNLSLHAHSFCFLLRSMFELSAKAYCIDHSGSGGPSATDSKGQDRQLVDVLGDITNHLTKNKTDRQMQRLLHGPMAELAKPTGFLSVTSMNQLVHNTRFSVDETHISTLFFNIFPLLEMMNK